MTKYIEIKDCIKLGIDNETNTVDIKVENNIERSIQFSRQKTGFGNKMFFICPICGSRRTQLFLYKGELMCRECYPVPVYRRIKNVTQGSYKYIGYRMKRFAEMNGIIIKRFPFSYLDYEKPKYKHYEKWIDVIIKLQALENMRKQAHIFGVKYKPEVINSVFKGENIYLYVCELYDLEKYSYDWEEGYIKFKNI